VCCIVFTSQSDALRELRMTAVRFGGDLPQLSRSEGGGGAHDDRVRDDAGGGQVQGHAQVVQAPDEETGGAKT